MNTTPSIPVSTETETAPVPSTAVPANEYERFLAALPEPLRKECQAQLTNSGFSANHPLFKTLADFYEKATARQEPVQKEPARNFIGEATLHADRSRQILDDFQQVPQTILAQIQPQFLSLLAALTGPVEMLATTSANITHHVEALPKRPDPGPRPEEWWPKLLWRTRWLFLNAWWLATDRPTWIVTGSIGLALTAIVLSFGAANLSRYYEQSYQQRLAHMEADSVENTVALNRLLAAGIALKVERNKDGNTYFLILQGAHKAAQPVNSPEGLAVEVWP